MVVIPSVATGTAAGNAGGAGRFTRGRSTVKVVDPLSTVRRIVNADQGSDVRHIYYADLLGGEIEDPLLILVLEVRSSHRIADLYATACEDPGSGLYELDLRHDFLLPCYGS